MLPVLEEETSWIVIPPPSIRLQVLGKLEVCKQSEDLGSVIDVTLCHQSPGEGTYRGFRHHFLFKLEVCKQSKDLGSIGNRTCRGSSLQVLRKLEVFKSEDLCSVGGGTCRGISLQVFWKLKVCKQSKDLGTVSDGTFVASVSRFFLKTWSL